MVRTPEQFAHDMQTVADSLDINGNENIEYRHMTADDLLLDMLCQLGYTKGAMIFDSIHKLYT
jgi:hypothetical protein